MRFLQPEDVHALRRHRYDVDDRSITTRLLTPFWNAALLLMPSHVAPNVITMAGFVLCYVAFYVAYTHAPSAATSLVVAACIFAYTTLDALDGKQARRTKNSTPLGEIFDHLCDALCTVPITLAFLWCLGVTDARLLHTIVFIVCAGFLREHVAALHRGRLEFGTWTGPGELLCAVVLLLCARALDQWSGAEVASRFLAPMVNGIGATAAPASAAAVAGYASLPAWLLWVLHCGVHAYARTCAAAAVAIVLVEVSHCEYSTRNGLAIGLAVAAYKWLVYAPTVAAAQSSTLIVFDAFGVGAYFAVLTCEAILCKMARPRPFHPMVVVGLLLTVFRFGLADGAIDVALCAYYVLSVLAQLCADLSLPLADIVVRVYVDGIYDLPHYAHIKQFEAARRHVPPGQRCYLIVGVCNDADATAYKRQPVLRMAERAELLRTIRYVDEVVENAPCTGLTRAFLDEHQIHLVVHGAEYDTADDRYYAVPRALGMTRTVPRTGGISTSEILRRVVTRPDLVEKFLRDTELCDRES